MMQSTLPPLPSASRVKPVTPPTPSAPPVVSLAMPWGETWTLDAAIAEQCSTFIRRENASAPGVILNSVMATIIERSRQARVALPDNALTPIYIRKDTNKAIRHAARRAGTTVANYVTLMVAALAKRSAQDGVHFNEN